MKCSGPALLFVLLFVGLPFAHAQCVDDPRQVKLDKDNVVRLSSFLCRTGDTSNDMAIKVEVHQFSDVAASLLISKNSSPMLRRAIGTPKVLENEIFRTYASLIHKFGVTRQVRRRSEGWPIAAFIELPAMEDPEEEAKFGEDDRLFGRTIRTVMDTIFSERTIDYPAVAEMNALKQKLIPHNMKFYYACRSTEGGDDSCTKDDSEDVVMTFWREAAQADFSQYAHNLREFNKQIKMKDNKLLRAQRMRDFKLFEFLSQQGLPQNFFVLEGTDSGLSEEEAMCTGFGWHFELYVPNITMQAVLIENVSRRAISLNGLIGGRPPSTQLRPVTTTDYDREDEMALDTVETLGPRQKLLIPIRIVFAKPNRGAPLDEETARKIFEKRGTNGFAGSSASFELPVHQDYTFGPELGIKGIVVGDKRIRFGQRPTNYIKLTVAASGGSCPVLQMWDPTERTWVDHDKVSTLR